MIDFTNEKEDVDARHEAGHDASIRMAHAQVLRIRPGAMRAVAADLNDKFGAPLVTRDFVEETAPVIPFARVGNRRKGITGALFSFAFQHAPEHARPMRDTHRVLEAT